VKANLNLMIVY